MASDFALLDLIWCIAAQSVYTKLELSVSCAGEFVQDQDMLMIFILRSFTLQTHNSLFPDVVLARWSRKCQSTNLIVLFFE